HALPTSCMTRAYRSRPSSSLPTIAPGRGDSNSAPELVAAGSVLVSRVGQNAATSTPSRNIAATRTPGLRSSDHTRCLASVWAATRDEALIIAPPVVRRPAVDVDPRTDRPEIGRAHV